jgi:anti-anti-sigma factor
MATQTSHPLLGIARLPGEHGPILRCSGELSAATASVLRNELALRLPSGASVLTLNLTECGSVDVEGLLIILDAFKRLRREGRRLVLVTGRRRWSRLLHTTGIARVVPTFPSEKVAAWALRGGGLPARASDAARGDPRAELNHEFGETSPMEEAVRFGCATAFCEGDGRW